MDQFPGSPLWIGVVPTLAWQAAVGLGADGVAYSTDDDLVMQWRAAGIVDGDGNVQPRWAQAMSVAEEATDGLVLVAQHADLAFLSNVHLGDGSTVVARSRATVEVRGGSPHLATMEPVVEVTLCHEDRWPGIKRVLPPVPEFTVDADDSADGPAAEPMDPALSPPSAPESSLTVTLAEGEETRSVHWYLDDGELYRVDQTGWYRVAPGDIHRTLGP